MKSLVLIIIAGAGAANTCLADDNREMLVQHCEYVAGQAFLAHPALAALYFKNDLTRNIMNDTRLDSERRKDAITAVEAMYDEHGVATPMDAYDLVLTACSIDERDSGSAVSMR